jgi:hypothetical protein
VKIIMLSKIFLIFEFYIQKSIKTDFVRQVNLKLITVLYSFLLFRLCFRLPFCLVVAFLSFLYLPPSLELEHLPRPQAHVALDVAAGSEEGSLSSPSMSSEESSSSEVDSSTGPAGAALRRAGHQPKDHWGQSPMGRAGGAEGLGTT